MANRVILMNFYCGCVLVVFCVIGLLLKGACLSEMDQALLCSLIWLKQMLCFTLASLCSALCNIIVLVHDFVLGNCCNSPPIGYIDVNFMGHITGVNCPKTDYGLYLTLCLCAGIMRCFLKYYYSNKTKPCHEQTSKLSAYGLLCYVLNTGVVLVLSFMDIVVTLTTPSDLHCSTSFVVLRMFLAASQLASCVVDVASSFMDVDFV